MQHPDLALADDGQHGVHYDIDHPEALPLIADALGGIRAALGCRPNVLGWELANEPAFRYSASSHTRKAFGQWLSLRHEGRIIALQTRWNESKTSFSAAAKAAAPTSQADLPSDNLNAVRRRIPNRGSGGSCKMADWADFNSHRVLRWASAMQRALQGDGGGRRLRPGRRAGVEQGGSCHRTFMRLNNNLLLNARVADHGMDRGALARLMSINGYDSNFGWPTEDGARRSCAGS